MDLKRKLWANKKHEASDFRNSLSRSPILILKQIHFTYFEDTFDAQI